MNAMRTAGPASDLLLRLELTSVPESAALIRSVIGAVPYVCGIDLDLLDDVRSAVSEACNNVILHAYPDSEPGPLIFSISVRGDFVEAVVRDQGRGISPLGAQSRPRDGCDADQHARRPRRVRELSARHRGAYALQAAGITLGVARRRQP